MSLLEQMVALLRRDVAARDALIGKLQRKLTDAQVESERIARANGDLCDALFESKQRIDELEALLAQAAPVSSRPVGELAGDAVPALTS